MAPGFPTATGWVRDLRFDGLVGTNRFPAQPVSRRWTRTVQTQTHLPKFWSRLPWRLRLQFLFSELWYPLFSATMICGLMLPVVAVLSGEPWVQVSYLDFLFHSAPLAALTLAVQAFLKRQGCLRPCDSPVLTWEMALFQVIRWPWAAYGSFMGLLMAVRGGTAIFRVTPKGAEAPASLPWCLLLPYVVVLLLTYMPTMFVDDAGAADGYFFFLILTQVVYTLALFLIILIHRHEVAMKAEPSHE